MAPHARAAEPRIFYGWWVAVAFSLIIFLSTGIRFAVGPFLKPVVGDLGIDRGTFSLVVSLSLVLYGVFDVNERPVRRELRPVAGGR
jgi:cyanate permease